MKSHGTSKTTRLRKIYCPSCGFIARVSRACIVSPGLPSCACGAGPLLCEDAADLIETGLMDINELSRRERTAVCHRMGWQDEIVRTNRAQAEGFRRRKPVEAMPF